MKNSRLIHRIYNNQSEQFRATETIIILVCVVSVNHQGNYTKSNILPCFSNSLDCLAAALRPIMREDLHTRRRLRYHEYSNILKTPDSPSLVDKPFPSLILDFRCQTLERSNKSCNLTCLVVSTDGHELRPRLLVGPSLPSDAWLQLLYRTAFSAYNFTS